MRTNLMKLLGIAAALTIAHCGWGSGEVVYNDDLYEDALEYFDENGDPCIPDMETFTGSGDQGGETAQGVPTTNPDEDRQGGDDNQFGGNQGDSGDHEGTGGGGGSGSGSGSGSGGGGGSDNQTIDAAGGGGQQADADAGGQGEDAEHSGEGGGGGAGCDAYGCCAGGDMDRDRDRIRCRCRLRIRGEDQYVLPACCELPDEEIEPGETDDDPPPPPPPAEEEQDDEEEDPV